jgi:hypothetical protein
MNYIQLINFLKWHGKESRKNRRSKQERDGASMATLKHYAWVLHKAWAEEYNQQRTAEQIRDFQSVG